MSILKKHTVNGASLAFIPSAKVKVFPCAYRGYISTTSIDPEAKAQTEYNYVNLHNQLGRNKPSYVVSYTSNTKLLKCVIGGYYFEITDLEAADFVESGKQKYLAFKLKDIPLPSSAADGNRKTKVLRSLIDINDDYLDTVLEGSTYYFTGLAVVENITGYDAHLAPFNIDGSENWEEKNIHEVLDTGSGIYSLTMKCDNQANVAAHKNAIALGEGSKTSADNQVVLGKYNKDSETSGDILVVGNGTGNDTRSNTFRLSKGGAIVMSSALSAGGSISTSGTLTVAGNSTLQGSETLAGNLTVGGTAAIAGNTSTSGTLTAAKKLTVSSEGAQITGNVNISSGSLTSAKKLTVTSEGADITGNSKVSGTFEVTGATTLKSTLGLTGNATLGGTVTAAKKLTVSSEGADITGNSKVTGTFEATGATTLGSTLTTTGDITVTSGVVKLAGNDKGTISYSTSENQFELNKPLKVTGTVTATGKMFAVDFQATGDSTVKGIEATGDINTTANMKASKMEADSMETTGQMKSGSISTGSVAASSLSTTGAASISGEVSAGSFKSSGTAEIDGATTIKGKATLSSGLDVTGASTMGAITASGNLVVSGTSNSIAGTLTLSGTGTVLDASSGGGKIGTVTIKSTGAISGATTVSASGNIESTGGYVKAGTYMEAPYFNATSDKRLKHNIKDYVCPNSILDLPIKEYEYINAPGKVHIGCMAQDLQEICPELVNTNDNGYLVIEESKLVYLLIQEVKNLKEKIERLENK